MAPQCKHVMSCFDQYAPYNLADGAAWDDDMRDAFGDAVVDTIEERAPNIRDVILHRQVLTPLDIERDLGMTEETSSRASSAWSSCSGAGRCPGSPGSGRRSVGYGCAA